MLFFGILGALVFRGVFIALGAALLQFEWVVWIFGAFLVFTGARMMLGGDEGPVEPHERWVIRQFRKYVPVTPGFDGQALLHPAGGPPARDARSSSACCSSR